MGLDSFEVRWLPFEEVRSFRCLTEEEHRRKQDGIKRELGRIGKAKRPQKARPYTDIPDWGGGICLFCGELLNPQQDKTGATGEYQSYTYDYPRGPRGGYRKPVQRWITHQIHKPDCPGWHLVLKMRALQELHGSLVERLPDSD